VAQANVEEARDELQLSPRVERERQRPERARALDRERYQELIGEVATDRCRRREVLGGLVDLDLSKYDRLATRRRSRASSRLRRRTTSSPSCSARALSAAGRTLFAASRADKENPNDADRLRKYLARHDLGWSDLHPSAR
jgi:sigma54-dependent transcription regulator